MNAKISVFVICVEAVICLLICNLHGCTFEILEFSDTILQKENVSHPIFKAILKFKNHPSIIVIKSARSGSGFYFCETRFSYIYKEVQRLKVRKAAQSTDILVKIKREIADNTQLHL